MIDKSTYQLHSRTYNSFCSIPSKKYLQKIHFFEKKEAIINNLSEQEKYFIWWEYAHALYNLGVYNKFIPYCNQLLAMSLEPRIESDSKMFKKLLTKKATALDQIGSYLEAIHVCKELLKMEKTDNEIKTIFIKSQKQIERDHKRQSKAILVLLISALLIIYFIKSIFLESFYPNIEPVIDFVLLSIVLAIFIQIVWNERLIHKRAKKTLLDFLTELQK